MLALTIAMTGLPSFSAHAKPTTCPGNTTIEMQECLTAQSAGLEKELARYISAAEKRIHEGDDSDNALAKFRRAQDEWKRYRTDECAAVFDNWSGGTIRVSMAQECGMRLTRNRISDIWKSWLTYMDTTSPTLPKPVFSDDQ